MTARNAVLLRSRAGTSGLFRVPGVLLLLCLALALACGASAAAQAGDTPPTRWLPLRGDASDLVVGPRGNAYALDAAGNVWLLDAERVRRGASWMRQPGQFRKLRATLDGRFWALSGHGDLYRLDGSVWRRVARNVRDVAATPDGIAWILATDGSLRKWPDGSLFRPAPPAAASGARSLVADEHGLPWLQLADGSFWRFSGTRWDQASMPGDALQQVAIGADGSTFAVSATGAVLRRDAASGRWLAYRDHQGSLAPSARHVAVGSDGLPWLVATSGGILAERPLQAQPAPPALPAVFTRLLQWQPMSGGHARQIDVGGDGTVYSVAPDGTPWRWNDASVWSILPGRIASLAAGDGGRAWGLDSHGRIRQLDNGFWHDLPGRASRIATGPGNRLLAILDNGDLAAWDHDAERWRALVPAPRGVAWLAVGDAGEPWLVDRNGTVRVLADGTWRALPGIRAATVDIGPDGTTYATTTHGDIYWLDREELQWKPATGHARQVAVGPEGAPWAVAPGGEILASRRFVERREAELAAQREQEIIATPPVLTFVAWPLPALDRPLQYQRFMASVQDLGIGADGSVFAVGSDGALLCFSNPQRRFLPVSGGQLSRIAVDAAGMPWTLGANGIVARYEGQGWIPVPEFTGKDIAIGADATVWAAGTNGQAYRYDEPSQRFQLVPVVRSDAAFKAERVAGGRDGALWVVGHNHHLYRCEAGDCRMRLAGALDVSVAPDGTVFALDLLGGVRRYRERALQFEPVNGNGVAIAAGPQGLPWLVTRNGQVDASGLFHENSRSINTAECAARFSGSPVPAPPAPANLSASDDIATVAPGDSVAILANDRFNGRTPGINDPLTIDFQATTTALRLEGGSVRVGVDAPPGTLLRGGYRLCPKGAFAACASAKVLVTVATPIVATPPGSVTAVTATAGNGQATISFGPPASDGGSPITGYTATSTPGGISASGSGSPIVVAGLTNGTPYTFTVTATNAIGTGPVSAPSNSVTPQASATVPGPPTTVTATAGDGQATISFAPPASDGGSPITHYTVMDNFGDFMVDGVSSPIVVTGLANGVAYTFTVTATNAVGTGPASVPSNSVTPQAAATVPTAPAAVTATAGDAQATISFGPPASDGGSPITGYTATSSPGGISASGSGSPIVVAGLTNGTPYTFTVTATNAIGMGPASAPSNSVTPQAPAAVPGPPTAVTATAGDGQATISFVPPASDGGSPITGYTATSSPGGISASGSGSPIVVAGLTNGTPYTFTVTATNAIGTGPASAPSNSVTPQAPAAVPGPPTAVTATAGDGQATISFVPPASDGGSPITHYTVMDNFGDFMVDGASSPIVVAGLANGGVYTFTVTATNAVGTGPASAPSNSVIPAGPPGAPTGVSAVAGNGEATVSFAAPADDGGSPITHYTVMDNFGDFMVDGASSPIVVAGLANGGVYTFTVTATNAVGTGPASAPSNSVTPAGLPGAPTGVGAVAGDGQATVSFSAPADDGGSPITHYTVMDNFGDFMVDGASSPIVVAGLSNGVAYTFTVTATNAVGTGPASAPSNSATPQPPTVPDAPTNVVATPGDGEVTVSFDPPANDGGSPILHYTVSDEFGDYVVDGLSSPIVVTGLVNGFAMFFTVTATNAIGTSPPSAPSNSVVPGP